MENPATKPSSIWPPFVPPFIQSRDGSIPLQNRIILALESLKSIKTSPEGSFQASKHLENTWNPLFRDFVKVWWLLASWLQSVARAPFIQVGFTPHIMNQKDRSNRRTGMEGREGGPRREGGGEEEEEENSDHENFEIYDFPVFTFFSKRKKSFGEYFSLRSVKPPAPAGWL